MYPHAWLFLPDFDAQSRECARVGAGRDGSGEQACWAVARGHAAGAKAVVMALPKGRGNLKAKQGRPRFESWLRLRM
jgi:hypothetical protein